MHDVYSIRVSVIEEQSLKVFIVDEVIIKHCEELILAVVRHNVLQKLEWISVMIPGAVSSALVSTPAFEEHYISIFLFILSIQQFFRRIFFSQVGSV